VKLGDDKYLSGVAHILMIHSSGIRKKVLVHEVNIRLTYVLNFF
jgi:hypothetical protein